MYRNSCLFKNFLFFKKRDQEKRKYDQDPTNLYQIPVNVFFWFQDSKQVCMVLSTEILSHTQFTEVNLKCKSNSSGVLHIAVVRSLPEVKKLEISNIPTFRWPLLNTCNSLTPLQIIIPKVRFTCSPTWILNCTLKHSYPSSIFRTAIRSDGNLAQKSMKGYDMSSF